jgi:Zn-dependent protease with chaperone function
MHFLLMFLLAVACLPKSWPNPLGWFGHPGNILLYSVATWVSALFLIRFASSLAFQTCWQLTAQPAKREEALNRFTHGRRRLLFALYAFIPYSVYLLGWGWSVQSLCTFESIGLLPCAELLILAPFAVVLFCYWIYFYEVERTIHHTTFSIEPLAPFWQRGAYLRFQIRQLPLALVGAVILLLIAEKSVLRMFPWLEASEGFRNALFLVVPGIFCVLPLALRYALGLKPLPPGPLRDRLETCARRLNFRYTNILLWETHGMVANAMVAGMLPFMRYVLLSDRLIAELTPEEVEAVFGHEIGHIKHRHMLYYMGFLLISMVVVAGLSAVTVNAIFAASASEQTVDEMAAEGKVPHVAGETNPDDMLADLQIVPLMTILGAYIFVVFGFLSRRCERQADIYGCRAVSCLRHDCPEHAEGVELAPGGRGLCPSGIRTFIGALEKVAMINGISRSRPGWLQSWQHSTIARRVDFLQRLLEDPSLEPRFQRTVFAVKWGILLTLGLVLWALYYSQGWENIKL